MAPDTPSPEAQDVPKGPETQGDPVLIEAEEALKRASEAETTALDLREKGLRVTLIDASLKKVNEKIATEKGKAPEKRDNDKLSKLVEKKVGLEKARAEIMAVPDAKADEKIAKVEGTLKAHATDLEGRLKEIDQIQARMEVVQTEITKYESARDQEGQLKYSAALKEMDELTKSLAALEKEGSEEKQRAQHEATLAAEKKAAAMREQEHDREVETAEKGLSEFEGNPEKETPEPETADADEEAADAEKDKDKPKSTSSEDPEAALARKKELLHDTLHKAAFGMAVVLEKDYPGEDGNAYEKTIWTGKAFLLKVLVMFGGTPKWAELLTPKQTEFLEKKVGMQFVEEDVKKDGVTTGEKRLVAKFIKPVEGWEPGIVRMVDVFESAYGKDGAAKAMEGIKPETTLAALEATAPASDTSETAENTRKLIAAMRKADDTITGETKVQEFLSNTQNAAEVQKNLEPVVDTSVAEAPREPSQLLKDLDAIPPASPEDIRKHIVKDLLPGLTDSTLTFTADMPLIDAWAAALKPEDLPPEKEAKWAKDLALFKKMALGEGTYISKDMLAKVKDDPDAGKLLATILVATDAMSAEEAHIIIQDAADGSLDESSMASLAKSTDKMLTNLVKALDGKTLGQALEEFKPKNEAEKKKLEAAKQRISGEKPEGKADLVIENTKISFELKVDDESTKALNYIGIGFSGNKMVAPDGATLRDFGDAKTVEIKSLGNDMFTLTATTPSTTTNGRPSGDKIDSVTFQGMDKVPSNIKKTEGAQEAAQT